MVIVDVLAFEHNLMLKPEFALSPYALFLRLQIESVSIGGTEPDSDDESLYPSDHYAIIADIQIRCLPHVSLKGAAHA